MPFVKKSDDTLFKKGVQDTSYHCFIKWRKYNPNIYVFLSALVC